MTNTTLGREKARKGERRAGINIHLAAHESSPSSGILTTLRSPKARAVRDLLTMTDAEIDEILAEPEVSA